MRAQNVPNFCMFFPLKSMGMTSRWPLRNTTTFTDPSCPSPSLKKNRKEKPPYPKPKSSCFCNSKSERYTERTNRPQTLLFQALKICSHDPRIPRQHQPQVLLLPFFFSSLVPFVESFSQQDICSRTFSVTNRTFPTSSFEKILGYHNTSPIGFDYFLQICTCPHFENRMGYLGPGIYITMLRSYDKFTDKTIYFRLCTYPIPSTKSQPRQFRPYRQYATVQEKKNS